jgi:hypothetical protein
MNKRKVIPVAAETKPAKCEDCHHFTGSAYLFRFGCSKGHAPDSTYSMNRVECADRLPYTRDEQIFRRFQHAPWSGEEALKKRKSSVLGTGTSLRKTLTEFETFLTSDQAKALRDAASALDQLSKDIELAARLLKQHQITETAKRQREREERFDKIAAEYFGDADSVKILEVAEDMAAFYSPLGEDWYRRARDRLAVHQTTESPAESIKQYRAKPSAQLLVEIRRKCAACLEPMGIGGRHRSMYDPRVADFEAFRVWRREQAELMRRLSTGDGIKG